MHIRWNKFLSILIIALLFSCQNRNSENLYTDFPQEQVLKGEVIELDTALFRYPFRVRIKGDKAVVLDLHGPDHYFQLFQYPEFKYIQSFGKRGDSPQDMLSAENIRYTDSGLMTLDANKSELTLYRFALSGDSLLRDEVVTLDKDLLRALDFTIYNDSALIIPDYSGDNRFCLVDRSGKLIRKIGTIPSSNKDALSDTRPALAQAWRSFIDYNPHNGVLATVTQLGEVLEIYNLKDSTHIVRVGPKGEPEFKVAEGYGIPTGIMGFSDVQVTDSAIYAVFHGRSFKEIAQQKEKVDGGKYIYVFSLQGEPLRKYVLDRYIYGIQVDEGKKIITATDVNNDQPIVVFHY